MTFKERAKLAMEALAKQEPVTFEQAKAQAKMLSDRHAESLRKELAKAPIDIKCGTELNPARIVMDTNGIEITDHKQFGDKSKQFSLKQITSVGFENEGKSLFTLYIGIQNEEIVSLSGFYLSEVLLMMRTIMAMNEKVIFIR